MTSPEGRGPAPGRQDEMAGSLRALALTYVPQRDSEEVLAAVRSGIRARRRRRIAIRTTSALAASAAVVVALVLMWPDGGDRARQVRTGTGGTGPTTPSTGPTSESTAPLTTAPRSGIAPTTVSPLAWRSGPAVIYTGYETVVWGGENHGTAFSDGAIHKGGRWMRMAPAPISGSASSPTLGAWTGANVLFVVDGRAAIWNGNNTWEDVADPPPVGQAVALVSGVLVGADGDAAYLPTTRSWRLLPKRPFNLVEPFSAAVTMTGDGFAVFGKAAGQGGLHGAVWHEAQRRWELLTSDVLYRFDAQAPAATWNGREIVLVNYLMQAASFEPATKRWRTLPNLPLRFFECGAQAFHLDDGVAGRPGKMIASTCAGMAVRSDAGGGWMAYRRPQGVESFIWGGEVLFGLGNSSGNQVAQPGDRLTLVPWAIPRAGSPILVGRTGLSLQGLVLVGQRGGDGGSQRRPITAEVRTRSGTRCTVSSTESQDKISLRGTRVRISPLTGATFEMVRIADGSLARGQDLYDLVQVQCDGAARAAAARDVARRLRPGIPGGR